MIVQSGLVWNAGSLERDILEKYKEPCPRGFSRERFEKYQSFRRSRFF